MKTTIYLPPDRLMLSLASLTPSLVSDLHAADIFTKVTAGPGSDIGNSRGAAWGDYDNDGFIDLFVPNIGPSGSGSAIIFSTTTTATARSAA
jgi:hypothetical protein